MRTVAGTPHTHTHTRVPIHTHVHTHTCAHTHTCTHTHTQTSASDQQMCEWTKTRGSRASEFMLRDSVVVVGVVFVVVVDG